MVVTAFMNGFKIPDIGNREQIYYVKWSSLLSSAGVGFNKYLNGRQIYRAEGNLCWSGDKGVSG
jgi:hypothetical protein